MLSVTIIPNEGPRTRERVPVASLSTILARAAQDPDTVAVHVYYPNGLSQLFPLTERSNA